MKYEIYGEVKEQDPDPPRRLRLFHDKETGDVVLKVVDEDGKCVWCGCLLTLTAKGTVSLNGAIDENLGFQLTDQDALVLDPDPDGENA